MKAKEVALRPNQKQFKPFSFADCFHLIVQKDIKAETAAKLALDISPKWVDFLMQLRKYLVMPFGLKQVNPALLEQSKHIGGFPIVARSDSQVILGFDDKHLDFRIAVETINADSQTNIYCSTYVKTHNILGKSYLFLVKPFHKLIVATCLNNIIRHCKI